MATRKVSVTVEDGKYQESRVFSGNNRVVYGEARQFLKTEETADEVREETSRVAPPQPERPAPVRKRRTKQK